MRQKPLRLSHGLNSILCVQHGTGERRRERSLTAWECRWILRSPIPSLPTGLEVPGLRSFFELNEREIRPALRELFDLAWAQGHSLNRRSRHLAAEMLPVLRRERWRTNLQDRANAA